MLISVARASHGGVLASGLPDLPAFGGGPAFDGGGGAFGTTLGAGVSGSMLGGGVPGAVSGSGGLAAFGIASRPWTPFLMVTDLHDDVRPLLAFLSFGLSFSFLTFVLPLSSSSSSWLSFPLDFPFPFLPLSFHLPFFPRPLSFHFFPWSRSFPFFP